MCLAVVTNRHYCCGNRHISVFAYLMAGENDDRLEWPFNGAITVSLLNQRDNHSHYTETITFGGYCERDHCLRVTSGSRAASGWGHPTFIACKKIAYNEDNNTEYLRDDRLCFRIEKAVSYQYSSCVIAKLPSWQHKSTPSVAEFTISEFSKHKAVRDGWYSPPFYTHPQGYKFTLVVRASGWGRGEGTHVAVGITAMVSEYNNKLTFPFRGTFHIKIINWRRDKHHVEDTVSITDENDDDHRIGGFIIERLRDHAHTIHNATVLPHSSLPYNFMTNTQYLDDDDCIRLVIVKVDIHDNKNSTLV